MSMSRSQMLTLSIFVVFVMIFGPILIGTYVVKKHRMAVVEVKVHGEDNVAFNRIGTDSFDGTVLEIIPISKDEKMLVGLSVARLRDREALPAIVTIGSVAVGDVVNCAEYGYNGWAERGRFRTCHKIVK